MARLHNSGSAVIFFFFFKILNNEKDQGINENLFVLVLLLLLLFKSSFAKDIRRSGNNIFLFPLGGAGNGNDQIL